MNHLTCNLLSLGLLLASPAMVLAQVSSVESREALLLKAERLTVAPLDSVSEERFAAVPDPFNLPEFHQKEPATTLTSSPGGETPRPASVSDEVILTEIAEKIRPTGVMHFGDDVLLLFGERKVRVGDFISVPHEGQNYKIQIMKADSRGFMLRLNDETISKRIQ